MSSRIVNHVRGNAVGYVALFAALGGTSYAAVALPAGSVHSAQLASGAVTHGKLAKGSVGENNLMKRSLTANDFKPGALVQALSGLKGGNGVNGTPGVNGKNGTSGVTGTAGAPGSAGSTGPTGPAGLNGSASLVMKGRSAGSVSASHGTSTQVPLSGASWTQAPGEMSLITGSVSIGIPASCTGSFGNALAISVDGIPNTFALAPTAPASTTATIPFVVSEVMEPSSSATHTITAALSNSCTKSGEDYTVSNAKIDVVSFH
jgi:hypothetical protein